MANLLSANLLRLKKSRLFWETLAIALFVTAVAMLDSCRQASGLWEQYGIIKTFDDYYFNQAPAIGIYLAVFLSLFLGTEYSDGTVRNKIIVGHSRTSIYLANFSICAQATLAVLAIILLGGLAGIPFLGFWQGELEKLAFNLLICIGFSLSLASIFTLIGTLSTRKSTTAVLSMLFYLGILMAALLIYSRLCEPEMTSKMMITYNGIESSPPMPNPNYVGGTMRTILEAVMSILPTGQAVLLVNDEIVQPLVPILDSLVIVIVTNLIGISLFEKKDLK